MCWIRCAENIRTLQRVARDFVEKLVWYSRYGSNLSKAPHSAVRETRPVFRP